MRLRWREKQAVGNKLQRQAKPKEAPDKRQAEPGRKKQSHRSCMRDFRRKRLDWQKASAAAHPARYLRRKVRVSVPAEIWSAKFPEGLRGPRVPTERAIAPGAHRTARHPRFSSASAPNKEPAGPCKVEAAGITKRLVLRIGAVLYSHCSVSIVSRKSQTLIP